MENFIVEFIHLYKWILRVYKSCKKKKLYYSPIYSYPCQNIFKCCLFLHINNHFSQNDIMFWFFFVCYLSHRYRGSLWLLSSSSSMNSKFKKKSSSYSRVLEGHARTETQITCSGYWPCVTSVITVITNDL